MSGSQATTEDVLWGWLNTVKAIFKYNLHMTRVENSVGPGWPDTEGTLAGNQFFLELKCTYRPVNTNTKIKVKFRPKQPQWHKRRRLAGARIFVLIQVGSGQADARRYLIGSEHIPSVMDGLLETELVRLSVVDPRAKAETIVRMAAGL